MSKSDHQSPGVKASQYVKSINVPKSKEEKTAVSTNVQKPAVPVNATPIDPPPQQLTQKNDSPQPKNSDASRKKLANILSLQRKRVQKSQAQKSRAHAMTNGSNEQVQISPTAQGRTVPSSSSTPSLKKRTKESTSDSTKKKKGLAKIVSDANHFIRRERTSPSLSRKNVPLRQQISVPRPITILDDEKPIKERSAKVLQPTAGNRIDHKKLEANLRKRIRRMACWSTVCCFITIAFVFVSIAVSCAGLYFATNQFLLLSRERALTDTIGKEWIMEESQCWLLNQNPIIYKNMSQKQNFLIGHCVQPENLINGASFRWKCIKPNQNPCKRYVRDISANVSKIYLFSNFDEFVKPLANQQ